MVFCVWHFILQVCLDRVVLRTQFRLTKVRQYRPRRRACEVCVPRLRLVRTWAFYMPSTLFSFGAATCYADRGRRCFLVYVDDFSAVASTISWV